MSFTTIEADPSPPNPGQLFDADGNITTTQWNNLIAILAGISTDKIANIYPLKTADDLFPFASIPASTEQSLTTYTGKGMMMVTCYGDGDPAVEIHYIKDGGVDTLFTTSDQRLLAPLVFNTSLQLLVKNTALTTKNASTVQSQGTYQ